METTQARHGRAILIVLAVTLGLGAVVWRVSHLVDRPAPTVPATATVAPAPAETTAPETAGQTEAAAGQETGPDAPASAEAPTFDVVRVNPDGEAVVAGTAQPGAEVTIYADSEPLARATADADGNFVALFKAAPTARPQALTLGAGDRRSEETVMLLPKAPPAPPAEVVGGTPPAGPATAAITTGEPATAGTGAAPEGPPPSEIAVTAIIRPDSVEVLPVPGSGGRVALGSISYAAAGEVTLAGVGTAGSPLRVYVDGRLAKEAAVGEDGRWDMSLDDVAAGLYTLRIDQLDAQGKVASRVETPFQRDVPRAPLPRPGDGSEAAAVPPGGTITVQPGTNLWTIARLQYGSGMLYTQIFTANRELIRDPELIYPGQIFTMPEIGGVGQVPDAVPRPRPTE